MAPEKLPVMAAIVGPRSGFPGAPGRAEAGSVAWRASSWGVVVSDPDLVLLPLSLFLSSLWVVGDGLIVVVVVVGGGVVLLVEEPLLLLPELEDPDRVFDLFVPSPEMRLYTATLSWLPHESRGSPEHGVLQS
jgi:hypothetical protein